MIVEGSLDFKLPTIWTDGKVEVGRVRWEDQRREIVRRKKMQVREKVWKSRFTVFFQWFVAPEGRKVGSRVGSHVVRWVRKNCTPLWREFKNCTPPWREAHFQVKRYKTRQFQTTVGSWHVQKVHAVVARSTFPSQKCEKLTDSDHFWTFRCRKSASCCGAKHIWKSKVSKTDGFEPFLTFRCQKSAN